MSKRQIQKMFQLMADGGPVELTSAMASVKKLARLAFLAQQFGYEYAEVRQGSGQNSSMRMLIVPDPSPRAQTRAAQNWAQFPQAARGGPLPPFVPDALELLKARINFDLTGKSAEKRMRHGAVGATVGCVVLAVRTGGDVISFAASGFFWVLLMGLLGIGVLVTRRRNAKFAGRLRAAGFAPVADETGRVRYLPPGGRLPGYAHPFGAGPAHGHPFGSPTPGAGAPGADAPGPYAPGPYAPGSYAAPEASGPYEAPRFPGPYAAPQAPGPYTGPQAAGPYGGTPAPYAHPGPVPQQPQPRQPPQEGPDRQPRRPPHQ